MVSPAHRPAAIWYTTCKPNASRGCYGSDRADLPDQQCCDSHNNNIQRHETLVIIL